MMSVSAFAFKQECLKVPIWTKGSEVPSNQFYLDNKIAHPITPKQLREHLGKPNWILLDVRKSGERVLGKIPKSIMITASYKSDGKDKNQFTKKNVLEKINKYLNMKTSYQGKVESFEDISNINFAVYCNGIFCHRSSFASCELRKWGIPFENTHIMLEGYPGWRENKFPIR